MVPPDSFPLLSFSCYRVFFDDEDGAGAVVKSGTDDDGGVENERDMCWMFGSSRFRHISAKCRGQLCYAYPHSHLTVQCLCGVAQPVHPSTINPQQWQMSPNSAPPSQKHNRQ